MTEAVPVSFQSPVGTLVASGTFALAGYRVYSGGNLLFGDSIVLPVVAPNSLIDTASSRCRLPGVSALHQ